MTTLWVGPTLNGFRCCIEIAFFTFSGSLELGGVLVPLGLNIMVEIELITELAGCERPFVGGGEIGEDRRNEGDFCSRYTQTRLKY